LLYFSFSDNNLLILIVFTLFSIVNNRALYLSINK
jgi:hypothetical protein